MAKYDDPRRRNRALARRRGVGSRLSCMRPPALPSGMRTLKVPIVLFALGACEGRSAPRPAVRLAADASDTIIINSRWPSALPVHAFDADGHIVPGAPIRFEQDRKSTRLNSSHSQISYAVF